MVLEYITADFFRAVILVMTPVLLASMGEVIGERSGMLNIALPGIMLLGACFGFLVSFYTGSPWFGLLGGIVVGVAFGIVLGVLTIYLNLDQILAGFLIMLLGTEFSSFAFRVFGPAAGSSGPLMSSIRIPILSEIPIIGQMFFNQPPVTYLALLLVPATYFFLFKTPVGLKITASGEDPLVLATAGVNPKKIRFLCLLASSTLAALGGGFLTTAYYNTFYPLMIGGRGWIAIAMVFFGIWNPIWIFGGVFIYSFTERFLYVLQAVGVGVPESILTMIPYVIAFIAFSYRKRARIFASLGKNY